MAQALGCKFSVAASPEQPDSTQWVAPGWVVSDLCGHDAQVQAWMQYPDQPRKMGAGREGLDRNSERSRRLAITLALMPVTILASPCCQRG